MRLCTKAQLHKHNNRKIRHVSHHHLKIISPTHKDNSLRSAWFYYFKMQPPQKNRNIPNINCIGWWLIESCNGYSLTAQSPGMPQTFIILNSIRDRSICRTFFYLFEKKLHMWRFRLWHVFDNIDVNVKNTSLKLCLRTFIWFDQP